MSEERNYDSMVASDTPNGYCPKCRQVQILIEGKPGCVNCSIKAEKSGLINRVEDPGHAAFEDVMKAPIKPGTVIPVDRVVIESTPRMKDYGGALDAVYTYLGSINVDSVVKFKQLMKLKKNVLDLKTKIQMFIDSK